MSDEQSLRAAYAANYPDDDHRRVLADWLEEHGDPRADWLRDDDIGPWMGPEVSDPVSRLVAALTSRQKKKATRVLAKIGPAAVPALLDLLAGDESEHRDSALPALQALCDASPTLRPLVERLRSDEPEIRQAAIAALGDLGETAAPAVPHLIPLLRDGDDDTRIAAVRALARLGTLAPRALRIAGNHLHHDDQDAISVLYKEVVRLGPDSGILDLVVAGLNAGDNLPESALVALRSLGVAAFDAVLAGMDDAYSDRVVRYHGFLGSFGTEGVRRLGEVARDRTRLAQVRRSAVEALGWPETWDMDEHAGEIAAQLLPLLDEQDPQLLEAVINSLYACREEAAPAVPALLPLLNDPHNPLCAAAVSLLCVVGPTARVALPLVEPLADHNDFYLRTAAVYFLKLHAAPDATTARFRQDLESADPAARSRAILNLIPFLLDVPDCADLLCRALSDPHPHVRSAGSSALAELRFPEGLDLGEPTRLALCAPEAMIREHIVGCLRNRAAYAVQFIPEFLDLLRNDKDPQVRRTTAEMFQWLPVQPPEVKEALREALRDPDAGVRGCATLVLRQWFPLVPEVVQALLHEVRSPELYTMSLAAALLARVDSPPPELLDTLRELLHRSPDFRTHSVLDALVRLNYQPTPEDVPHLVAAMRMGFGIPCEHAGRLLSRVGAPAVPALVELLAAEMPEARRYAGVALAEIGPAAAAALPALTPLLQDPNYFTRSWATPAVAAVGGSAALPELLDLVGREDHPDVLRELTKALVGLAVHTPDVATGLRELTRLPGRAQTNAREVLVALAPETKASGTV